MPGFVTYVSPHALGVHRNDLTVCPVGSFLLIRQGQCGKFEFPEVLAKSGIFCIREMLTRKNKKAVL